MSSDAEPTWAAAQVDRQRALAELPFAPARLSELFDAVDVAMQASGGCNHDGAHARAWLAVQGVDVPAAERWLKAQGADCDCAMLSDVEPRFCAEATAHLPAPHVQLFPAWDDVFVDTPQALSHVLLPLLSVDLSSIQQGEGRVHFVSVMGNGDPELDFRDDWFRFDHIRFAWDGQRYRFDGDLSCLANFDQLEGWYQQALALYQQHAWFSSPAAARADFEAMLAQREGAWTPLQKAFEALRDDPDVDIYQQLYQKSMLNFWVTRDAYQATGRFIQGGAYLTRHSPHERDAYERLLRTPQSGRGPRKVGTLTGYDYVDGGEDRVTLFADPARGQVTQSFGWT